MAVTLRAFNDADYPLYTALYNRCRPEVPESEASLRAFMASNSDDILLDIVAEQECRLVAGLLAYKAQVGKGRIRLELIAPEGDTELSELLYDTASERMPQAQALSTSVREDWPQWLAFYRERGFAETHRQYESRLELSAFDPSPFAGALAAVCAAGLEITTLAELPDTEATPRKLYDAITSLLADVPFEEPLNI